MLKALLNGKCALRAGTLPTGRVSAFILIVFFTSCSSKNQVNPRLYSEMPQKIVWAWERPEDLRFLDPKEFGVAFLAQTIFLENQSVAPKPRRQPLDVAAGIYMIAVTRIETNKVGPQRPSMDDDMTSRVTQLIQNTLELPNVKAIQIDFDAVVSERAFYRLLVRELRKQIPAEIPLTMTALASWCTGDAWFNDFPVDEAVPMVFQMGADDEKIKAYLRNGNDWIEPLCRGSYGVSVDDPIKFNLKSGRRVYYFGDRSWSREIAFP